MFRVGPEPGAPIPRGSILMCYYCEEIIGRTKRRIRNSNGTWTSFYYIDYITVPDWTDLCIHCGQLILGPAKRTKYFLIDTLMGRIVYFLAEKPMGGSTTVSASGR